MRAIITVFAAVLAVVASGPAHAQSADVTFFVIGKHANFSHADDGDPTPVDFSFFSEIFLTARGNAGDATLEFPTGEVQPFDDMRDAEGGDRDNLLLVSGEDRFARAKDLARRYPDGDYHVRFRTPSGDVAAKLSAPQKRMPPRSQYSSTHSLPAASSISANITRIPCSSRCLATPRPMPWAPPLTMAVLPLRSVMLFVSLLNRDFHSG